MVYIVNHKLCYVHVRTCVNLHAEQIYDLGPCIHMCLCVCVCVRVCVCACVQADLVENEVFPPLLFEGTVVLHRNVVRSDADMERVLLGPTLHVHCNSECNKSQCQPTNYLPPLAHTIS